MKYQVVFSVRAKNEMEVSWAWYEERLVGLGDRFLNAASQRIAQLQQNPEIGSIRHGLYRDVSVPRFPFLVVYIVEPRAGRIFIQSVLHTRRNTAKKQ